jgi:hypothetical protein
MAVLKSSSSWELASCKLDKDTFIYFKFGTCKVLNLNSIEEPPSDMSNAKMSKFELSAWKWKHRQWPDPNRT